MPRITPSTHYKRHLFLRTTWTDFSSLYGLIPVHEQWQVHEFYQPSKELTKDELVAHVKELSKTKPALVHQVGKHVRLMEKVFRHVSKELNIPQSEWKRALSAANYHFSAPSSRWEAKNGHRYAVTGVVRPELDVAKFSRALLDLAEQQRQEELNVNHELGDSSDSHEKVSDPRL